MSACAGLALRQPLQVSVVDVSGLPGEGLELRLAVKLRVQNPNEAALDYDGVTLELEVSGRHLASGVSDARGSVPRFGEALITVPVIGVTGERAAPGLGAGAREHRGHRVHRARPPGRRAVRRRQLQQQRAFRLARARAVMA